MDSFAVSDLAEFKFPQVAGTENSKVRVGMIYMEEWKIVLIMMINFSFCLFLARHVQREYGRQK